MSRMRTYLKIPVFSLLLSQTLFTNPAFAAGYQINEVSPSLQGDATAGAAAADNDVSAMFTNPATLSTLIQNQLYFGGSEIMPHIRMSNASATHTVNIPGTFPASISAPVLGETSQSSISKSGFAPDAYFGWRLSPRMVVGIAVVAPWGLTTSYDNNSVLRFGADNSSVDAVNIVPAISWAINDKFSVGIGAQIQYFSATFSNFNGPYTGIPVIDSLIASNHASYVNGSSWGAGYTVGGIFKPDLKTRYGLGFRSQISEGLSGNGRQFTAPGGIVPAPSTAFLSNFGSKAYAGINTPAVLTLSAVRDIGDWTIKASAQVNFWSTFKQLSIYMPDAFATNSTIETKWKNTLLGSIGADYHITPAWTVRSGVAYDQTPTVDGYRDARIPDNDRIWLSLGASYYLNHHVSFDGAYTHIFIKDQSINVTQAAGSSINSTVPLEVNQTQASFKGSADIVALAVRYSF
jgi:long-chain fatty acid transport protein